jgi:hypothetical protein
MHRAFCRSLAVLLGAAGSLGLAACDRTYVYRPVASTTVATVAGRPASYYDVPPEAPRGHVRIATMGVADIQPKGATDEDDLELRALHIRMIVANNSDRPWSVDTREQRAVLPGGSQSRPAYAKVDHGNPPIVEVPARGVRTFDLYYPLPEHLEDEDELPSFDSLWQINTDARLVVQRTPFERIEVQPDPSLYAYGGGPYWYDPYYVRGGAFVGVGLGPMYVNNPVVVRQHVYTAPPARRTR